jgi:type I restriction enzyme, S subunit
MTPESVLPEGWSRVKLGDVVYSAGRTVEPGSDDRRPYVALEHMAQGFPRLIGRGSASDATSTKLAFKIGDILYGKLRPNLKKSVEAPFDGICSTDILALRAGTGIDKRFLLCLTHWGSFQEFAVSTASGTKMPRTSWKLLREFEVPLPPPVEQRKIAAILSSIDETIDRTETVLAQIRGVRLAATNELLRVGISSRENRFLQAKKGGVSEGWHLVRVGAACEKMFVGIAQAATHAYVPSGGVPIVRTTNLKPNAIETLNMLRISDSFANVMKSKSLRPGDVLTARTGYPGVSAVVPVELDGAQCFTLLVSRPGPDLEPRFLCHVMNSEVGKRIVERGQAGGAQQNLNVGVFQEAVIPLPPLREQVQIADAIDSIYARECAEQETLVRLRGLRTSLLFALMSGEIRVTPREDAA